MANQIYCQKDETFYKKLRSGIEIRLMENSTVKQRGDLYECPRCHNQVIGDFGRPYE